LTVTNTLWNGANVTTAQALIAELPDDAEVIPLPLIRGIVNEHLGPWGKQAQHTAIKSGAIHALPGHYPPTNARAVDRDEAVLILVAAVLAFAAGVAVVAMIRAIRVSGVDPSVFVQTT
jgi:hypothetical protein